MARRYFKSVCLVIKRTKLGETDQLVQFLSQEEGLFFALAKGVRKQTSKKLGNLEPGTLVEAYFVTTKGWPILTQLGKNNQPVDFSRFNLKQHRLLFQLLEVFSRIFVTEPLDAYSFHQVRRLRELAINSPRAKTKIQKELADLIAHLGFQHPDQSRFSNLTSYIEALTEKPLNSNQFLTIN